MENLLGCKGYGYECTIGGTFVRGRIQIEDREVYLCQDRKDGQAAEDKLGYMYSWAVGKGTESELSLTHVKDFKIVVPDATIYKDWQVGDKIAHRGYISEVIFRSGELVVCKDPEFNCALSNYTCEELFNTGGRLVLDKEHTPEMLELTLEQVAKLAGIPVEQLRIKDK